MTNNQVQNCSCIISYNVYYFISSFNVCYFALISHLGIQEAEHALKMTPQKKSVSLLKIMQYRQSVTEMKNNLASLGKENINSLFILWQYYLNPDNNTTKIPYCILSVSFPKIPHLTKRIRQQLMNDHVFPVTNASHLQICWVINQKFNKFL